MTAAATLSCLAYRRRSIGGISLDWSKNRAAGSIGVLFQDGDPKCFRSDQIDYDYFAKSGEDLLA